MGSIQFMMDRHAGLFGTLEFGRNSAHYWELIALLTMVSIILWSLVLLTIVARLGSYLIWSSSRRHNRINKSSTQIPTDA